MARPKHGKRHQVKVTRTSDLAHYKNYTSGGDDNTKLNSAMERARHTHNMSEAAKRFKVPQHTLQRALKEFRDSGERYVRLFTQNGNQRLTVLVKL